MTEEELAQLADAWLAYWHAPEKTPTRSALFGRLTMSGNCAEASLKNFGG